MTLFLAVVALALVVPWGAAPVARHLARLLSPRAASLALPSAALLLAGGVVSALVGLFHVPFLAHFEQLPLSSVLSEWPAVVPVSCVAGAILASQGARLVRRWREHRSLIARTWELTGGVPAVGDLLVVPGAEAEAFALPGHRGRAGRVVVTEGMLRALNPAEQGVLLAHERAHLSGRHHLLSLALELAGAVHPALRGLRDLLDFHLERWADERAAASVGDRRLAASAIARAALAAAASEGEAAAASTCCR